jgi:hypothetical protein
MMGWHGVLDSVISSSIRLSTDGSLIDFLASCDLKRRP